MTQDKLTDIVVKSERFGTFQRNLEYAYSKIVKQTGYEGSFSDVDEMKAFFSSFEVKPIPGQTFQGVEVSYRLKNSESPVAETKRSGSGPSNVRVHYRL